MKLLAICVLLLFFSVTNLFLMILPWGPLIMAHVGCFYSRLVLKIVGVEIATEGLVPKSFKHKVIVANHLSYIDILVLMAIIPCRFVTFTEFQKIPGLGFIARLSGTLFVHRSHPSRVKKDIAQIEKALRQGSTIAFFPEGSSFDGSALQPFKSSLFQSVITTKSEVIPVCIRYLTIDQEPITLKNREKIYYYGEMQLIPQLIGILKLKSIKVEMIFESAIDSSELHRKQLAEWAQSSIQKHFRAVSS